MFSHWQNWVFCSCPGWPRSLRAHFFPFTTFLYQFVFNCCIFLSVISRTRSTLCVTPIIVQQPQVRDVWCDPQQPMYGSVPWSIVPLVLLCLRGRSCSQVSLEFWKIHMVQLAYLEHVILTPSPLPPLKYSIEAFEKYSFPLPLRL